MGRHSAPRASLRTTLSAARRATAAARTAAPSGTRRTAVGAGAALAAVALTASTAAALADTRTPATAADASRPTPASSPTTLPQPALGHRRVAAFQRLLCQALQRFQVGRLSRLPLLKDPLLRALFQERAAVK